MSAQRLPVGLILRLLDRKYPFGLTASCETSVYGAPYSVLRKIENRLIQINYPGSGNYSQFAYDGYDHVVKIVEVFGGSVSSTKQFVQIGGNMQESRDSTGSQLNQYFRLGQIISGTIYFATRDYLGSIRELTSSTGSIGVQYGYDPYGRPEHLQGSLTSDFQYAGYYVHARSALDIAQRRVYQTNLGVWLSRDPIGETGGLNLYAYLRNPITFSDPTGLGPFDSIFNDPGTGRTGGSGAGSGGYGQGTSGGGGGGSGTQPQPSRTPNYHDCNRKCPDGSPPVRIVRNAIDLGRPFFLCKGDPIVDPNSPKFIPALGNPFDIPIVEQPQATTDRQNQDRKGLEGFGKDVQNAKNNFQWWNPFSWPGGGGNQGPQ